MPGRGPAPKPESRTRHKPIRGDWKAMPGIGWQHGRIPPAPTGLMPSSVATWSTWFRAWWASHWTPDDIPGLTTTILLFDAVQRRDFQRVTELRQWMDGYGISPKGQQDRRWKAPEQPIVAPAEPVASPYQHLRVVNE